MAKITFLGAGSSVFVKNILGDAMLVPALSDAEIALYDIDPVRLSESETMLRILGDSIASGKPRISTWLGTENRRAALSGADFIVNAIQVGRYEPATVADFEIPKRYGLRQTIGDTLGIGGIFRALRTAPVMLDIAREIEEVAPRAWFLNYTNPMAMLTGILLQGSGVKTVGLCHSVQICVPDLLEELDIRVPLDEVEWHIAGINHMAWLLKLEHKGTDLYPEVRSRAEALVARARAPGATRHKDMVRLDLIRHFGYYITESSEHNAEYTPYWIKRDRPDRVEEFGIPLDEYPRRCISQIEKWAKLRDSLIAVPRLEHTRSKEYGSRIMEAILLDKPERIHGNVLNHGFIPNLPDTAVVEVPCLVDRNGVQGCHAGRLPAQCAALNMTNINVQTLAIEAALTRSREKVYQAAFLDPRCAAELDLDQIRSLCDELFESHSQWLPEYRKG